MAAIMIRKVLDCSDGKAWRKLGPFLSNDFFLQILLFLQEKQEKQEKQKTVPKFGNLTEDKIFGTLRIPIFGRKK